VGCNDYVKTRSFFVTLKKEEFYQIDTLQMSRADVKSIVYRCIRYYNNTR
jgi:hypothetical protein